MAVHIQLPVIMGDQPCGMCLSWLLPPSPGHDSLAKHSCGKLHSPHWQDSVASAAELTGQGLLLDA